MTNGKFFPCWSALTNLKEKKDKQECLSYLETKI